jgi:protein-disulfide isomerase
MKRYLPLVIVALIAIITIAAGAALYWSKRPAIVTAAADTKSQQTATLHARGPAKAPVTLEEFGDFQCPPCATLSEPINHLEREYRPRLRVIFRHLPLVTHQHAREAACAAEAAALQGRFWEMHDLLYREQSNWSKAPDVQVLFHSYAGILGLDLARFKRDMDSEQVKARVAADQQRADSLGVKTTPTILINGRSLAPAALNPDGIRAALDEALKTKPAS